MKKICFVDYDMSVVGGVEQVTASLVNALADRYEVHLVSLVQAKELAYALDRRVQYSVLLPKEDRLRNMRRQTGVLLSRYCREKGIGVVIAQGNYPGYIVSSLWGRAPVKLVFCDHGALMNQWQQKDIVFLRLISSLLSHRTVTLTEQSREAYHKHLLVPERKLRCIYNWIDLDVPRSQVYAVDSKRILAAGRFGREKGFPMLVEAFATVAKTHPDWHLDIFGDGETREEVSALVEALGLQEQIHLPGMCEDLAQRYRNYAMYVLSSYREGMPLVLLEAKANRLPIVSFDIMTGPREIVRDGVDGILVPPYDIQCMGQAMNCLMEDAQLRQALSDRSQDNLEKFSKQTILGQWCALIDSL